MSDNDIVTTGELSRTIGQLRVDHDKAMERFERSVLDRVDLVGSGIKEDVSRLEATLTSLVTRESFNSAQMETHRRISAVENWQTWAIRLVLGGFVTTLIGAVLALSGATP